MNDARAMARHRAVAFAMVVEVTLSANGNQLRGCSIIPM
ncbi:hypothetical protein GRAN_5004 [Granulicella sibirica]|uniref:Uncharacterized protein n=1 Tax=Granulicella sibirica TaxID=2479048 RepID=A0A4Q0ST07_9BACT|nr:hypothetical protein GRAN_5004 [Granulicella sibirica]